MHNLTTLILLKLVRVSESAICHQPSAIPKPSVALLSHQRYQRNPQSSLRSLRSLRLENPPALPYLLAYTSPDADSTRAAFRNNNADTTNNTTFNAFPPNPRNTAAVHGVTCGFRIISAITRTNA